MQDKVIITVVELARQLGAMGTCLSLAARDAARLKSVAPGVIDNIARRAIQRGK